MPDSLRRFKADIFQALAHPTRIAILELLGSGELSSGALIEKLGIEQSNLSQHLAVLRAKQLVTNRKAGNQVFYSVRDPLINEVLRLMRVYFQDRVKEAMGMLDEAESSEAARLSAVRQWLPRSIECLKGYGPRQLSHDLVAGLTVGLVALPLAMAFANRFGRSSAGGLVYGGGGGVSDLGAGRVAHADRRADGRVCGYRRGHCGKVRAGWPGAGEA